MTVSVVKYLNLETICMEYTKHLNGRQGKRIKVEKLKKEQRQKWRTSNVKCEIKNKEKYFKNKDPGDQEN
jgi:hypothetical protein